VDNIFPHHEAEIAQTEGCTGKKFVRYWLHCAHLLVDGQKMSKSLGNFYTLSDVLEKGYTGREVRYALMRVNFRKPLNFTWEGMDEARESLGRLDDWLQRLRETAGDRIDNKKVDMLFGQQFEEALDDDLNISGALGFLFETIRQTNRAMDRQELDANSADAWLNWWKRINNVLAIEEQTAALPPQIAKLAEARAQARLAKDFRRSDELRDELSARGWEARDTKDGQKITRRGA
jgi:cysteinyl-tRNA synthetase